MIMVDGIGKIYLKPDQSSKQTQRYLALLNPSLILGKEGKLTTTSRVCSRICQTPSRSVESWKAWKD